jgi:hypothetical protein
MKPANLCTQKSAASLLAKWWTLIPASVETIEIASANIEVREDIFFTTDQWLSLGTINLRLPQFNANITSNDEGWSKQDHYAASLLKGGYEWRVPEAEIIDNSLIKILVGKANDTRDAALPTGRVRDAIAYVLLRLGLEMPRLDPDDLASLPFDRPVTLVADTNAVLQGGVDFSVRFLYPMARLRLPEPVHAELNNQATQYFTARRGIKSDGDKNRSLAALRQRLTSQGGLRALLRVQFQSGVEIERLQVEAEEPRHFDLSADNKGGDRSSVPDRMILETALRHRALIASGHPVRIMTSDQGLARSALIECIAPLYFPPRDWESLFGRTYLGAVFAPLYNATASFWHRIPLTEVLWELATCFGSARLQLADGATFTVTATRQDLSWSPFHAREDLLWVESSSDPEVADSGDEYPTISRQISARRPVEPSHLVAPKFSVDNLVNFWNWMASHRHGTLKQAASALGVSEKTSRDYVRIMASGGFVKVGQEKIEVDSESFDSLWTALRGEEWDRVRALLLRLPAFAALCEELAKGGAVSPEKLHAIQDWALRGFQALGEICGAILKIPEIGLCFCEPSPNVENFCPKALEAYSEAIAADSSSAPLVQSGAWLETLAAKHRVHPLFAPSLLQEAITMQRLNVVFEGSQPFREKADHVFRRILSRRDELAIEEVPLYRGDYLAANRASVHLRIEPPNP